MNKQRGRRRARKWWGLWPLLLVFPLLSVSPALPGDEGDDQEERYKRLEEENPIASKEKKKKRKRKNSRGLFGALFDALFGKRKL